MSIAQDKFIARGAESLTDAELLSLLLDEVEGLDTSLSKRLLDHFSGSLTNLSTADLSRLRMFDGMGLKRAMRLLVASEWGRRVSVATGAEQLFISSSGDVVQIFRPRLELLGHEECWVLYLNSSNGVIEQQRVSQGGITMTVVDHRLIVKRALELLATKIVMVHNHPSGSVTPSEEDNTLTQRLKSAAALFDIVLLDHIIISSSNEFSFRSDGLL
ncbi:MAG: DNA repair protein RadC [Rikenellaceae bacterium]